MDNLIAAPLSTLNDMENVVVISDNAECDNDTAVRKGRRWRDDSEIILETSSADFNLCDHGDRNILGCYGTVTYAAPPKVIFP